LLLNCQAGKKILLIVCPKPSRGFKALLHFLNYV
jgi:hypothetical protein